MMFPLNRIEFWNVVGVLVVVLALLPVLYFVVFLLRFLFAAFMDRRGREIHLSDPLFGNLKSWEKWEHWEGDAEFGAGGIERVMIFIDANANGPTESQRALFQKIRSQYSSVLPEIEAALRKYVGEDWEFELTSISIPTASEAWDWSAGYFAETDEDGDMGYDVHIKDWSVSDVIGSD